jgi:hypothetical protein
MKKCSRCKSVLSYESFAMNSKAADRRTSNCLACMREIAKAHYKKHGYKPKPEYQPDPLVTEIRCPECCEMVPVSGFLRSKHRITGLSKICQKCKGKKRSSVMKAVWASRPRKSPSQTIGTSGRRVLAVIESSYGKEVAELNRADRLAGGSAIGRLDRCCTAYLKSAHSIEVSKQGLARIVVLNKIHGLPLMNIGWSCMGCSQRDLNFSFFEIDHIKRRSQGGSSQFDNLQCLCPNCHKRKTQGIDGLSKDHCWKIVTEPMKRWLGMGSKRIK